LIRFDPDEIEEVNNVVNDPDYYFRAKKDSDGIDDLD
jgi:hypothetical protein